MTVRPVALRGHIRPIETVGFTLFALFHTLHSQSITRPHFALLFYLLSSSPEKSSASEVVKLSSRRHELTVEGHDLSSAVCSANFGILGLFFTFSLSLFHVHCCFVEMLLCDFFFFFFLLKFIFQDLVEYRNVWPCWGWSLCALSKSYFLLCTSQYWERFENVSFFVCSC